MASRLSPLPNHRSDPNEKARSATPAPVSHQRLAHQDDHRQGQGEGRAEKYAHAVRQAARQAAGNLRRRHGNQ
jgi:hypothetical protein